MAISIINSSVVYVMIVLMVSSLAIYSEITDCRVVAFN